MPFIKSHKVLFGALALAFAMAAPVHAQQKSVAVTAIVEHPALDAVRDGVKEGLAAEGFEEGKNLKWQYQSAQGNTGTAAQIARKFIGDQVDVIVAIATPSAQAVAAATRDIPLVYSAVTDPVAAKLVPSMAASGTNITGASDALELDKQIDLNCVDLETGALRWSQKKFGKAAITLAQGHLWIVTKTGDLVLVHANPKGYLEVARVRNLLGDNRTVPTPANRRLYLRDLRNIYCLDIAGE